MTIKGCGWVVLALFIGGCASLGDYQAACEKQHGEFAEVVACLKTKVAQDPRGEDDLVRLYFAYADAAVERVERGTMSEAEARLALAELYTDLKNIDDTRDALKAESRHRRSERSEIRLPPRPITCFQNGAFINCY